MKYLIDVLNSAIPQSFSTSTQLHANAVGMIRKASLKTTCETNDEMTLENLNSWKISKSFLFKKQSLELELGVKCT